VPSIDGPNLARVWPDDHVSDPTGT